MRGSGVNEPNGIASLAMREALKVMAKLCVSGKLQRAITEPAPVVHETDGQHVGAHRHHVVHVIGDDAVAA